MLANGLDTLSSPLLFFKKINQKLKEKNYNFPMYFPIDVLIYCPIYFP